MLDHLVIYSEKMYRTPTYLVPYKKSIPNVWKVKQWKLLKDNRREYLPDHAVSRDFLKEHKKHFFLKERWNIPSHIKIKNFYSPKDTHKRLKRVEKDIPNTSYCKNVKNCKSVKQ